MIRRLKIFALLHFLFYLAGCITFGQDQLTPASIVAPQKKLEKTYFFFSMKNYNAFGVDLGISQAEVDLLTKVMIYEINACKCFKEAEVSFVKNLDKESLPKGKNIIYFDIAYRVTTNPGLMFMMNFLSMATIGLIPSGFGMEVTSIVKVFNTKQEEVKVLNYKNQRYTIGGILFAFALPFINKNKPYILEHITTDVISLIVNSNLVAKE
ncbi:hypothetical protein [Leptospira stimsonii]|uniref:Lipoprotein n=1 Tax=Leptospira stimsonii TaxID=2202203 RepID=A0A8B3CLC1_9LEPT|nr:hypothetical protein [Leptospira stimsonii]RHX83789.1 hypothetical protein DLM78_20055 [Leptospira stimsonii]